MSASRPHEPSTGLYIWTVCGRKYNNNIMIYKNQNIILTFLTPTLTINDPLMIMVMVH